jgi:hypothetical protein
LSVSFIPADTVNYTPATASVSVNVAKATPILTWANPADIVYGTPLSATQLNASAGMDGSLTYNPPAGTVLNAGAAQVLSATFIPADTTKYNAPTITASINVSKATPVLTWANPADTPFGTALSSAQLNASANVEGSYTYNPPAGTLLKTGVGQMLAVTFTPADTTNYIPATASVELNVVRATPTITWANPADIVYGSAIGAAQLNATANVEGTIAYKPAVGTRLDAGMGQVLSVTFTPADTNNYIPTTATATLNVLKATPTLTWEKPADIGYGSALGPGQLNASANYDGSYSYSPGEGAILKAGSGQTLSVTFVPSDATNYRTTTMSVSVNVLKAIPEISWPTPATIAYGTPLSSAQLNATANTEGAFAYSPDIGVVLPQGSNQLLSVTFTPADSENYVQATKTVTLTVRAIEPPVMTAIQISSGTVSLTLTGSPGLAYEIQASTNLTDWTTIGASTADENGKAEFQTQDAESNTVQFYRCLFKL